jgi:hypothetical protein
MSETKRQFARTPPDVEKEKEEEEKIAENEAEIQPVIEKEIEEVLEPPATPEQKLIFKLWVVVGILGGILCIQYIVTPISRAFKYTNENIQNTDEITILKEWTDEQTATAKEQRKAFLCSKITDQTKGCDKVKPLPTSTPTPTVKIIYPTP